MTDDILFFVFHVFCFSMHEPLITDIGYPGIYSLSVKRRDSTDKLFKINDLS